MSSASLCKFCFALVENLFPLNPNGFAKCRKSHTPDTEHQDGRASCRNVHRRSADQVLSQASH